MSSSYSVRTLRWSSFVTSLVACSSQANLNQDLDVVILVVHECLEPLFFNFIHLDLSRYHRFWFDFP